MARSSSQKVAAGRKGGRSTQSRRGNSSVIERNYRNYRDTLLEWSERPAVRYVAGGIGLALIARFAVNMSDRYPELTRFFRENLDSVEGKLREFRGLADGQDVEARH